MGEVMVSRRAPCFWNKFAYSRAFKIIIGSLPIKQRQEQKLYTYSMFRRPSMLINLSSAGFSGK